MNDWDGDSGFVQSNCDWSNRSPSIAVVDAIAALENVESTGLSDVLDATLFEYVDPEALDALVTGDGLVSISFPVDDYTVRIDRNRLIVSHD